MDRSLRNDSFDLNSKIQVFVWECLGLVFGEFFVLQFRSKPYLSSFFGRGDDPFGSLVREVQKTFEDFSQRTPVRAVQIGHAFAEDRRCREQRRD
jgi:hypothetical protein